MINQVLATNPSGSLLVMSLQFPYDTTQGIIIDSIEGLDPVKATLVGQEFAQLDGGVEQNAKLEVRDITLHLALAPDYALVSVQELRAQVYSFFMPKQKVLLQFEATELTGSTNSYDISGTVESCESSLFSSEPMIDVVIRCWAPDFVENDITTHTGNTVADTTLNSFNYTGTVETGILFKLNLNRSLSEFTLKAINPDGTIGTMDFAESVVSGDVVEFNTKPGQKGLWIIHSGVRTPSIYAMSRTSKWPKFQPGFNSFQVYATGAAIPYEITYYRRYGGL
jgi:tail protein